MFMVGLEGQLAVRVQGCKVVDDLQTRVRRQSIDSREVCCQRDIVSVIELGMWH